MGRTRQFIAEDHFGYSVDKQVSICKVHGCGKEFKGKTSANLKRHPQLNHENYFYENVSIGKVHKIVKSKVKKIQCDLNRSDFLKCCVGLITTNSLPFQIFDSLHFQQLTGHLQTFFKRKLTSRNITDKVDFAAKKLRAIITKEIKDKLICLKIDSATRMDRSILGINVQFLKKNQMCVRTLGMLELRTRHSAIALKEEVLQILHEYNITATQIYSCTTDNGANMIKTSKLLNELQDELLLENEIRTDDNDVAHRLLTSVLSAVRCAAHTLQLAVSDVVKSVRSEVDRIRGSVKTIRTISKTVNLNMRKPPLDIATRWNSTYEMLESLYESKSAIKNLEETYPEINISDAVLETGTQNNSNESTYESPWDFIENFVTAFQPLYNCTKRMQNSQYTMGDMYRDWLECELELASLSENHLATLLKEAMSARKAKLFNNDALSQ